MIQTIDLRGQTPSRAQLLDLVPRAVTDVSVATEAAEALIDDVRSRGVAALREQAERFDGGEAASVRVPESEIADAVAALAPDVRAALDEAIDRVRSATAAQIPAGQLTQLGDGAVVEQRWQPVDRVGLYVPGGKAVYPSSVVMNVVPAQSAGVQSIALVSPPQREFGGHVHPVILGAAGLLGVTEVYAMGGAGAIGALAYGVDDIGLEPVQIITGPGNVYVAAAKRLVRGRTGIDSEAGPTEILIIADETADARYVAADLVSQAEHDELAAAVLVTTSPAFAGEVRVELEGFAAATLHSERVLVSLGGQQSAIVLVDDLAAAARFSDAYGPEHLEIQVSDSEAVLASIHSAGAIFMGSYSPVSLGDYLAGSNHVLPTGGQSRFSSGLGAYTFLKPQQVIRYDKAALEAVAGRIHALAHSENLPAHAEAVEARFGH
ncbi:MULTISPECIES: histidinol dehydrogenase [Subtercola]|uniref:Histidinol dehydrogenase n=1 Tax=Subtercola vilae TaxID=2056433 RepID=A0A4T2BRR7_9MICO|nr:MULTISPECIES: histidinol dehydrogenase [Subtercola]MEA9983896.1 histidinol dehydrogenase [Subtercola sp. RTI3]TIH34443.1 histidinol dehydrogenase [Subtercola vilae]